MQAPEYGLPAQPGRHTCITRHSVRTLPQDTSLPLQPLKRRPIALTQQRCVSSSRPERSWWEKVGCCARSLSHAFPSREAGSLTAVAGMSRSPSPQRTKRGREVSPALSSACAFPRSQPELQPQEVRAPRAAPFRRLQAGASLSPSSRGWSAVMRTFCGLLPPPPPPATPGFLKQPLDESLSPCSGPSGAAVSFPRETAFSGQAEQTPEEPSGLLGSPVSLLPRLWKGKKSSAGSLLRFSSLLPQRCGFC